MSHSMYPETLPARHGLELPDRRVELLTLILGTVAAEASPELSDHLACLALSASFRGKLCQQFSLLPRRRVEPGQHLYRVGNPARSVFLVQNGLIKTAAISPAGEELTLRMYKSGDVLGELCLCGGGRQEEAVALEVSTVTEIPIESLLAQVRRDPEVAVELASLACERLADAYGQIESLSWDTVLDRLIRTLLRLADELGESSEAGTRLAHYIRQEELARLVGARREVVSGLLNRLRASGHISYSPRGAITVRRAGLERFLEARASA
jgi:CRP/FNR family transcriptional regulator, cyclic AMP receptor protein